VGCARNGAQWVASYVSFAESDMLRKMQVDDMMTLTNNELLGAAYKENKLTSIELELLHRLESYVAMYGDYLEEQVH
tara:strand:+ start:57 stop:287 length:231 start_codon:yes stop_codon:yes gene_type:complete